MMMLRVCAFFALFAPGLICLELVTGTAPGYITGAAVLLALPLVVVLGLTTLHGGWKRETALTVTRPGTMTVVAAWLSVLFPLHGTAAYLVWSRGFRAQEWFLLLPFVPVCWIAVPILLAPPNPHPIRGDSWRNHA